MQDSIGISNGILFSTDATSVLHVIFPAPFFLPHPEVISNMATVPTNIRKA
jgi:hypothetical protein